MAKKDKELTVVSTEEYNFPMLLNDIQESAFRCGEDAQAGNKAEREWQSGLIVMQMLVVNAIEYNDENYRDDDKLRNAIDVKINNDSHLLGYIFFVSRNPQFDYSWNYLRKRVNSYKEFLVEGIRFLDNVLADINMLVGKPRTYKGIHVVFDDIIDVFLIEGKPYVKVCVLWKNFHRIVSVKREYNITVKSNECILVTGKRKELADTATFIKAAFAAINTRRKVNNDQ